MNNIRENTEQEVVYLQAKCDMPKFYRILYFLFIIACIAMDGYMLLRNIRIQMEIEQVETDWVKELLFQSKTSSLTIIMCFLVAVLVYLLYRWHRKVIKTSSCIVTNKVVKGVKAGIFSKNSYNYRLDEIENIEIVSMFGIHTLALQFSQGQMKANNPVVYGNTAQTMSGANVFMISNLVDYQEVYDKLSELLASVKNDKDVAIDIQMKKIETEERKAAAFETFAAKFEEKKSQQQNDAISTLESLARLKEVGLITEEEYNAKKIELLQKI